MPRRVDWELLFGSLGAGALLLVHALASLHLRPSLLGIPCLFKALLAIPCPSCGMTRCVEALGCLDFPGALRLHPLLALGYAALWIYVPYALGALAGLWPRLRPVPTPVAARVLRTAAISVAALTWAFLIWDGR